MLTEGVLALENTAFVAQIRSSMAIYTAVNAMHILGLALLIGAVLTFDVRASGIWKVENWRDGFDVAVPVAATGLVIAIITGSLLFAVRGSHYVMLPVFLMKMAILSIGVLNIIACHRLVRRSGEGSPSLGVRLSAMLSAVVWISALFMGRWIAFSV